MNNDESFKIGPYIIGNTLGAGVTGKVRLAFHKQTGEQVAVKIINKNILNKPDVAHKLQREIAVMNLIEHKNVLNLYDYYESPEHLYLVLEYAQNGDLYDYLIDKSPLDSKEALIIFQQIIEGLDFCHKHYVSHRDLKPENILLDSDNSIKLADFGMCAFRPDNILCKTSCGSPHYASPEVVSGIEYDGRKSDIWSCGVILYALLVGKLPFDDPEIVRVLDKIKLGEYDLPEFLPADVKNILTRILSVDVAARITIDEIRLHPWYTSNQYITKPVPPLSPIAEGPVDSIKEDILQTITDLGLGDLDIVKQKITEDGENYVKTYYKILDERKKRRTARELNKKPLKRAKSEAGLKITKALRSSGGGSASKSGSGKLMKRTSLAKIEEADVRSTPTRGNTTPLQPIQPSLTSSANNKRSKFLSFWFGSSDSHLKKISTSELTDGVASHKPIGELTNDIESALESIGSTYTFTNKRDRIKAQVTKDSKNIKFSITILIVVDCQKEKEKDKPLEREPTYFLSFSRRAGSKEIYNEICNSIKRMLNTK